MVVGENLRPALDQDRLRLHRAHCRREKAEWLLFGALA